MSALEPGLYRATVCGVADTIVTVKTGVYATTYRVGRYGEDEHKDITDARPLIVLDLDAYDTGKFLLFLKEQCNLIAGPWARASADVINQIEAQTKLARIPEPEPGERVMACTRWPVTGEAEKFLRLQWSPTKDKEGWHWVALATGHVYEWHNLIDPTLIREGIN